MPEPKKHHPLSTIYELYRGYQTGSSKPTVVVRNYLDEIERLNPLLGAYQEVWADTAMEMAVAADKALAAGYSVGPFHGVPYALKDIFHVKGKVTTCGSAAMLDNVAGNTSTVVERLKAVGGIILGKTKPWNVLLGAGELTKNWELR